MLNKDRITAEERAEAIAKYPLLLEAIKSGNWEYSPSKLKADYDAFAFTTWVQVHPILTTIIFIIGCVLGTVPAIIFAALLIFQKAGKERYELSVIKLRNGTLAKK